MELEGITLIRIGNSGALFRMNVNKGVVKGMCVVNVDGTSYVAISDRYLSNTHFSYY